MINFVSRAQLDHPKYTACVKSAIGSRMYAESWFLDAVCTSWGVLVYDDYLAVMPLPFKRKFGIPYIYLAPWIQQLGVFSPTAVSPELLNQFIQAIPAKFRFVEMMINASNPITVRNCSKRLNYILPLHAPYETLYSAYSKGRKSSLKQAERGGLSLQWSSSIPAFIRLFKQDVGQKLALKKEVYERLDKLIDVARAKELLHSIGVHDASGQLIGAALIIKDQQRWVYLCSALTEAGRALQAMTFLLDGFIREHANTQSVLDFEGSMVPGIAGFFKSFGAQEEIYGHYKRVRWLGVR